MKILRYLRVHPKYIIRHKILVYLKWKVDRKLVLPRNMNISNMPFIDLCEALKIDYTQAMEYHHGMHIKDEEQVLCQQKDGVFYIGITEQGYAACIDQYWLREGRKELNERIYDQTKWVIPVITLIVTVSSLLYTVETISSTKADLQNLKLEVETIKAEVRSVPQTKKPLYLFPWYTDTAR